MMVTSAIVEFPMKSVATGCVNVMTRASSMGTVNPASAGFACTGRLELTVAANAECDMKANAIVARMVERSAVMA
jgi:hypothetical protein